MLSNQELLELIASATSDAPESYKSMQELLAIIASCVGIDDDGNPYIRVQQVE